MRKRRFPFCRILDGLRDERERLRRIHIEILGHESGPDLGERGLIVLSEVPQNALALLRENLGVDTLFFEPLGRPFGFPLTPG